MHLSWRFCQKKGCIMNHQVIKAVGEARNFFHIKNFSGNLFDELEPGYYRETEDITERPLSPQQSS